MIIEKCSLKYFFINLALFVLGFLVCTVPVIYNDYLKYGYIGYGYKDVLNFNYYLLWQNLFYPTGFLTNNPVYIFSLIMFFVLIFNPERKMSNLVGAVPIVSVMVESFTYVHHESYGARHWLAYIPVLVLFYFKFLQYVETKFKRISTYTIPVIVLMIAINLYKCYSSYVGGDIFYYGNEMSSAIWADIKMRGFGLLTNFFLPIDQQIKTPTVLFIVFILSVILTCLIYLFKNNKINFIREIKVLIVYFSISYIFLTGINVINYYSNVINIFSDAEYKDVLIGNGPHINSFYENIGTIEKAMKYHAANNDAAKVEYLSSVRKNFLLKAQKEIVRDPLGVSHSWKNLQSSNYIIEEKLRRDEAVVY
jgi:hypothetical protein